MGVIALLLQLGTHAHVSGCRRDQVLLHILAVGDGGLGDAAPQLLHQDLAASLASDPARYRVERERHIQPLRKMVYQCLVPGEAKSKSRARGCSMRRHTYFAQFCAGLILVFAAYSQNLPQGVQKVTSVEGITEYAYPNGLHLLLFPDSSKPKLTVNVTYLVGSRHEGSGEGGMAHLIEHMLFLRTKSGRDVKKELTDHGAQWNGTTSDDRTNYFETVTASDDNLRWAIGLEAERMVNMRMEKQLLDTEMTVVRNEFEASENNPFQVLNQRVASAAYTAHGYGRSTIGNRSDIERVPIERLDTF